MIKWHHFFPLSLCLIGGLWAVLKPVFQWHHRWGIQANRNCRLSNPDKWQYESGNLNVFVKKSAKRWCHWKTGSWTDHSLLWDTDWVEKNGAILSLLLVRTYYMKIGWKVVKWSFKATIKFRSIKTAKKGLPSSRTGQTQQRTWEIMFTSSRLV